MISLFLVIFRLLHHLKKYFVKESMKQLKKGIIRSIRSFLKIDDKLVMICEIGIYAIFV